MEWTPSSREKRFMLPPAVARNIVRYGIPIIALAAGYVIFYTAPFLTTGLSLYTLILVLLLLFYKNIKRFTFRFLHSHVIIVGPGHMVPALARNFISAGFPVIVIEKDQSPGKMHEYSEMGARVFPGDPLQKATLQCAGIRKASYLLSVTDDDGLNSEIAVRAYDVLKESPGKGISCFIHIVDPTLCGLLFTAQHDIIDDAVIRLEFFNIYRIAAYLVLRDFPPFPEGQLVPPDTHLLVVGGGRMGENVIRETAKRWRDAYGQSGTPCTITLIDRKAKVIMESLRIRYPTLSQYCEIIPLEMELFSPEFFTRNFTDRVDGSRDVTSVYVCIADEYLGLSVALDIVRQMKISGIHRSIPIIVRTRYSDGLASILYRYSLTSHDITTIHAFPLIDRTCGLDLILGSSHEMIARAIHEEYLRNNIGHYPPEGPAIQTWEKLSKDYREANRSQAETIFRKLKKIDTVIVPYTDWNAPLFQFSPEEMEFLARDEHDRWMDERRQNGWTYGEIRNEEMKKHPCLVPYDELSPEDQEKDRRAITAIPRILRTVDLGIIRVS